MNYRYQYAYPRSSSSRNSLMNALGYLAVEKIAAPGRCESGVCGKPAEYVCGEHRGMQLSSMRPMCTAHAKAFVEASGHPWHRFELRFAMEEVAKCSMRPDVLYHFCGVDAFVS